MVVASANNVDFMIKGVTKFQAFGQELWITTTEIGLSIVTIVILIIAVLANRKMKRATEVPGTFQNIVELAVESLDSLVNGTMGHNAKKFVNYIGTIFIFILFCNIGGLFGLRTPTGDFGVTFMTAIVAPGVLKIHEEGGVKEAALMSGFIEILPEKIVIMAEVAEWPGEIDASRAEEAKVRAERRLKEQSGEIDIIRAETALRKALIRLSLTK